MCALLAPPRPAGLQPGHEPSISVVIAAYEAAETVTESIDSVLQQGPSAHEVIVVDDGSTDDLDEATSHFGGRIIRLRHPHNRGLSAARNTGIARATGELVAFHDADDVFLPGRLDAIRKAAADRPDLDIFNTDEFIEVNGKRVRRAYEGEWMFETEDQRTAILENCFILRGTVRRDALLRIGCFDSSGGPDERVTDDWDLYLRLIFAGSRAGLITKPLACYRVLATAISANRPKMERAKLLTLRKALRELPLTEAECRTLRSRLALQCRDTELQEAKWALERGASDARRRSLAVVRRRGNDPRTRSKALVAVIAPGYARRRLRRDAERSYVGAVGVRVETGE